MSDINVDDAEAAGLRAEFVLAFTILKRIRWIASKMQGVAVLETYEELVASLCHQHKYDAVYARLTDAVRIHQETGKMASKEFLSSVGNDLANASKTVVAEQAAWI